MHLVDALPFPSMSIGRNYAMKTEIPKIGIFCQIAISDCIFFTFDVDLSISIVSKISYFSFVFNHLALIAVCSATQAGALLMKMIHILSLVLLQDYCGNILNDFDIIGHEFELAMKPTLQICGLCTSRSCP